MIVNENGDWVKPSRASEKQELCQVIKDRINNLLSEGPQGKDGRSLNNLIAPLFDDQQNDVMNIQSQWALISILADTGATKHVSPNNVFSAKVDATERSKS